MNIRIRPLCIAVLALVSHIAFAHDPKEHEKEQREAQAGPDCAAMKDMDMSKMDMNDPIMKAIHEKCMGHQDDPSNAPAPTQPPRPPAAPQDPHGAH